VVPASHRSAVARAADVELRLAEPARIVTQCQDDLHAVAMSAFSSFATVVMMANVRTQATCRDRKARPRSPTPGLFMFIGLPMGPSYEFGRAYHLIHRRQRGVRKIAVARK
jgi:hypothetical protein